jgi:hypothetical protein
MKNQDLQLVAGDLLIKNFDFQLTTDETVIAQRVQRKLLLFKGDYWLDTELGVPYFQSILGTKNSLDTVQAIIMNAIQEVEGVKEITEFNIAFNDSTRTVTIEVTLKDDLGNEVTVTNNPPENTINQIVL